MSKAVEYKDKILEIGGDIFEDNSKDNELMNSIVLRNVKTLVMPYQFDLLEESGRFEKIEKIFEKRLSYEPGEPSRVNEKIKNYDSTQGHDLETIRELLLFSYMKIFKKEVIERGEVAAIVDIKK